MAKNHGIQVSQMVLERTSLQEVMMFSKLNPESFIPP